MLPIPDNLTIDQTMKHYKENYYDRNVNTKKLNSVYVDWRDEALVGLSNLKLEIGKWINSSYCDESSKHIGKIILKYIPKDDDLKIMKYASVKEVLAYATRAWEQRSKVEFFKLKQKYKDIAYSVREMVEANREEYGMPN